MTRTVTIRIEGEVQGVNFRSWTRDTATTLGLTGWVRNLRDGTVEAMLSGPEEKVEDMLSRCYDGPSEARVERVRITENNDTPPNGFSVLPTT